MTLSPYEHLLSLYAKYQDGYGWTIKEIDETDLSVLLDQLCVLDKVENGKNTAYIDDIVR